MTCVVSQCPNFKIQMPAQPTIKLQTGWKRSSMVGNGRSSTSGLMNVLTDCWRLNETKLILSECWILRHGHLAEIHQLEAGHLALNMEIKIIAESCEIWHLNSIAVQCLYPTHTNTIQSLVGSWDTSK